MPFIVRWPGRMPAGQLDEKTVLAGIDLFPTLCAIAGAEMPAGVAMDGEDLARALLGKPMQRKGSLFWEYGRNEKFFAYPRIAHDRSPALAVREGKWKLLINRDGTGVELYDLSSDRHENTNVAAQNEDLAKRLADRAMAWRKTLP